MTGMGEVGGDAYDGHVVGEEFDGLHHARLVAFAEEVQVLAEGQGEDGIHGVSLQQLSQITRGLLRGVLPKDLEQPVCWAVEPGFHLDYRVHRVRVGGIALHAGMQLFVRQHESVWDKSFFVVDGRELEET